MAFSAVALCRVLTVAMRGVLNGVVVGAVYVKSAGRHMGMEVRGGLLSTTAAPGLR